MLKLNFRQFMVAERLLHFYSNYLFKVIIYSIIFLSCLRIFWFGKRFSLSSFRRIVLSNCHTATVFEVVGHRTQYMLPSHHKFHLCICTCERSLGLDLVCAKHCLLAVMNVSL